MLAMSPTEAADTIGPKRFERFRPKKDAESRLRPMDISPAIAIGMLDRGRPLLVI